jgi:hypothetical protein
MFGEYVFGIIMCAWQFPAGTTKYHLLICLLPGNFQRITT